MVVVGDRVLSFGVRCFFLEVVGIFFLGWGLFWVEVFFLLSCFGFFGDFGLGGRVLGLDEELVWWVLVNWVLV